VGDLATVLAGIGDALTLTNLAWVVAGVAVGQFVGAVPGIGPVMAMAIAVPFTFVMSPLAAISFLVGVNKGGLFGGAVPAVLINTPGTPDAAATALDGFPLAKAGKPVKAMKMALYASVTGDTCSDIVLITVAAPLAAVALLMGPVEVFCLMVFAFAVIAGLVGGSLVKGLIAAAAGLLGATVGLDPEQGTPRLIFGHFELYDGLPLAPVAIGMLAVAEILRRLAAIRGAPQPAVTIPRDQPREDARVSWAEYWGCRVTIARGAAIAAPRAMVTRSARCWARFPASAPPPPPSSATPSPARRPRVPTTTASARATCRASPRRKAPTRRWSVPT
jgi:putative tricarboxylic transport membrane protein